MSERRRGQQQEQHPAVGDVMRLLSKSNHELLIVQRHLESEFQRSYPDEVNPCKIVSRIKKIQEDMLSLGELCRELLAEKQDLIDKARANLVGQRSSLQQLLASSGLPLMSNSDDEAYTNLNQVIDEWTLQVRAKTGEDATKALEATNGTMLEKNEQTLRVAYAKSIHGPTAGAPQSSSLAAAAIVAATFAQQYDVIGWAPKEYNPDEKQSTGRLEKNRNDEAQKDGATPHYGFVWDEKSGYYYDAASGFYYDGNPVQTSLSLPPTLSLEY
ncbi:hypothetical protein J5N97_003271 [Dioscorea zingiberensis]|uniref:Protein FAM33A n=1 Tax=Dioscorea zingiberensis TaxID=325984 RepID=A0A9D5HPX7_9LILI|nr:hypothetical protein J5N97_003271 [Dioscorea zingiberensis]